MSRKGALIPHSSVTTAIFLSSHLRIIRETQGMMSRITKICSISSSQQHQIMGQIRLISSQQYVVPKMRPITTCQQQTIQLFSDSSYQYKIPQLQPIATCIQTMGSVSPQRCSIQKTERMITCNQINRSFSCVKPSNISNANEPKPHNTYKSKDFIAEKTPRIHQTKSYGINSHNTYEAKYPHSAKRHQLQNFLPSVTLHQRRYISKDHTKAHLTQKTIKKTDANTGISRLNELVYESSFSNLSYWGKIGIVTVSLPSFILTSGTLILSTPLFSHLGYADVGNYLPFYALSCVWSMFSVAAAHFFHRRIIYKIYHNPRTKEFTALTVGMFIKSIEITFTEDDCRRREVSDQYGFLMMAGSIYIKDRLFILNWKDFSHSVYYNKMMHYDEDTKHVDPFDGFTK